MTATLNRLNDIAKDVSKIAGRNYAPAAAHWAYVSLAKAIDEFDNVDERTSNIKAAIIAISDLATNNNEISGDAHKIYVDLRNMLSNTSVPVALPISYVHGCKTWHVSKAAIKLLREGKKIDAIKTVRVDNPVIDRDGIAAWPAVLSEAKRMIEAYIYDHREALGAYSPGEPAPVRWAPPPRDWQNQTQSSDDLA